MQEYEFIAVALAQLMIILGIIAVCFYVLSRGAARDRQSFMERIKAIDEKWSTFVRPNPPIIVDEQKAETLVVWAMQHNLNQMMDVVHQYVVSSREPSEGIEIALGNELYGVLARTRDFLRLFHCPRGNLSIALKENLPISQFGGELAGDRMFRALVHEVSAVIRSIRTGASDNPHLIADIENRVQGIRARAVQRRDQTERLLVGWIYADDPGRVAAQNGGGIAAIGGNGHAGA